MTQAAAKKTKFDSIQATENTGPLAGITVLDLSRILAGPTCTQLLGDMGAEIIKVERPNVGDDTRKWGPPYVEDESGKDTKESAYYLSSNRNKRSIAIDMSKAEGQRLIRKLASKADILIENFKVGGMKKYGLSYEDLSDDNPQLIYCSISGFGQTGPYASRPGYDFLIQAMGGIMSFTGEPDGYPMKAGVGIADVVCGLYASNAILAALHHRHSTQQGQYIELSLLDTQVSWLVNGALNYLTSGITPKRFGNGHPNIVPYDLFPASDGYFVLAVGNDEQFKRFCGFANHPELALNEAYKTNSARVHHREVLTPLLRSITEKESCRYWIEGLEKEGVPCGPVNDMEQLFNDPQIKHREMQIQVDHPLSKSGSVDLIANPIKLSATPVSYRKHPPVLGEHTEDILQEFLDLSETEINHLREKNII